MPNPLVNQPFSLRTLEEVESFEYHMRQYSEATTQFPESNISLAKAWRYLEHLPDGPRAFSALLDVFLSVHFVQMDLHATLSTWNKRFSPGKLEGGSILDSTEKFFGKMDIHRFSTAYVLRYRSSWDKILGLFVLLGAPDSYEHFMKAKSKKRAFKSLSGKLGIPESIVSDLLENLQKFDDAFRTSEAHGVSALRKWNLSMQTVEENSTTDLLGYWNWINSITRAVDALFESIQPPIASPEERAP